MNLLSKGEGQSFITSLVDKSFSLIKFMNIKRVLYYGIMTAPIGAMLGFGVNYISQRTSRRSDDVIGGAIVGFVIGSTISSIVQSNENSNPEE